MRRHLRFRGMLDRQVLTIAPLAPGAKIIPHRRVTEQTQCQIRVGRPVRPLTMRNDFFLRCNVAFGINSSQLSGGFEESLRVKIVCPFQMNCTRDRTPALGPYNLAHIFGIASGVHYDGGRPMQFLKDILDGGNPLTPWFHLKLPALGTIACCVTGKPASRQALKPPFSIWTASCPKNSRNQNSRAERIPAMSS